MEIKKMERKITSTAGLMGVTAIILGAFGAHALKQYLSAAQLSAFETGVKYQMYHALFLLFLGLTSLLSEKAKTMVFQLVVFGVILFSGSIYVLTTQPITNFDCKPIGIVTPIGGALLIAAWTILFWNVAKRKQ